MFYWGWYRLFCCYIPHYIGVVGRMSRPFVIPDVFSGEGSFEQWMYHFENVAVVNKWSETDKLQWLKVRLTGRAQAALQRFPQESNYKEVKENLLERFEPSSKKERYKAELQSARKKKEEDWADLADRLKKLAQKGYPDLEDKATEQLALNSFLSLLDNPQVAFGVRQKRPTTLDEAVSTTLEMECYATTTGASRAIGGVELDSLSKKETVAGVGTDPSKEALKQLTERMEKLEAQLSRSAQFQVRSRRNRTPPSCWTCGRSGHIARFCDLKNTVQQDPSQGNEKPSTA